MSDVRSSTPLSPSDYEAIEAAVMETGRGRWFMAEYARRNRQADTLQLLGAIGRIERVVGLGVQETSRDASLIEAAALIHDLRCDLDRISGRTSERSSGLAAQIEDAAGTILGATEDMQEAAWSLRESGAADVLCDRLDRRAAEIAGAVAGIDAAVQRIDKIADTIAMLDASLRAFAEVSREPSRDLLRIERPQASPAASAAPEPAPFLEAASDAPRSAAPSAPSRARSAPADVGRGTIELLDDDIVFDEVPASEPPLRSGSDASSEQGLRMLDAMPADRKLAYFA